MSSFTSQELDLFRALLERAYLIFKEKQPVTSYLVELPLIHRHGYVSFLYGKYHNSITICLGRMKNKSPIFIYSPSYQKDDMRTNDVYRIHSGKEFVVGGDILFQYAPFNHFNFSLKTTSSEEFIQRASDYILNRAFGRDLEIDYVSYQKFMGFPKLDRPSLSL